MKKVLVLVLVVCLCSMANAMTLKLTGIPTGPLMPSDTVTIGFTDTTGFTVGQDQYFVLVAAQGPGTLDGANAFVLPGHLETGFLGTPADMGLAGTGIVGYAGTSGTTGSWAAGQVVNGLVFHCDAIGDVLVQLWVTSDFGTYTLADSATIKQIPEPMTVALLGLGGLFLRRRMA